MSRFLRFLYVLCTALFVGNAFAATGYVCNEYRVYTACATGYYMVNGSNSISWDESGNWCQPCSSLSNTATFCPGGSDAPLYAVTLSMNDGTGDNFRTIYASETLGWYTGTTGTSVGTSISSLSSIPTRAPTTSGANTTNYTFKGFYTSATGGTQWIDATGKFVDNTLYNSVFAPKTLYAQWSETTVTGCTAGKYVKDGNCVACPAGTYQPNNESDATACTPCGAGKWSEAGASSCSNIIAGCYGTNGEKSCPNVCDNGYYSPAGASECTKCTGSYTNSGDNAADHAFPRSCQITCNAGYAVAVPGGNCVNSVGNSAFGTGVFFTSPGVHTVSWGDITPFSFCPVPYSSGNDRYAQDAACVASNAAAGKVVTATPTVKYIKFSMVDNTTQTLYLVEVMPRSQNGAPITVEYSQDYSSTSGITNPTRAVDGVYESSDVVVFGGLISNRTTLSGVNLEYTVKLPDDGVPVASVDIIFNPSSLYQSINYVISTSMDGETWTPIYSTRTASSGTLAARMYSSSAPMLLTRRFLLYGETSSPAGSFAPARDIYLVPGNSSLGSTVCPTGSYTNAVGQSACVPCQNGTTTSATGATSCNATCANNANVGIWKTAEWSNNTVSNVCAITACDSTYVLNNNVCSACACTKGVDATSCTVTGTSANNECQFSFACAAGYETASGATSGTFKGVPGSVSNLLTACNAKCVAVHLHPGNNSPTTVYTKYNGDSWYSDKACQTKITEITAPTKSGYILTGYWYTGLTAPEDISADATLPVALGYMRIAPVTDEDKKLDENNTKVILPEAYAGKYTDAQTWYARWVHKCDPQAGALCLGPYYDSSKYKVEYINCCLPGYNKDGMDVSTNGTTCPTDN